jgi:hypothetical protein
MQFMMRETDEGSLTDVSRGAPHARSHMHIRSHACSHARTHARTRTPQLTDVSRGAPAHTHGSPPRALATRCVRMCRSRSRTLAHSPSLTARLVSVRLLFYARLVRGHAWSGPRSILKKLLKAPTGYQNPVEGFEVDLVYTLRLCPTVMGPTGPTCGPAGEIFEQKTADEPLHVTIGTPHPHLQPSPLTLAAARGHRDVRRARTRDSCYGGGGCCCCCCCCCCCFCCCCCCCCCDGVVRFCSLVTRVAIRQVRATCWRAVATCVLRWRRR